MLAHTSTTSTADPTMIGVSDEGQKLLTMLNDRQAFQNEFLVSIILLSACAVLHVYAVCVLCHMCMLCVCCVTCVCCVCVCVQVLGEMVIGAFKHAGRRRMAFRVGTLVAQFHR